MTHTDRV